MTRPVAVPQTTIDDQALMLRVASGEEPAIGQLYDRFGPALHAAAWRITGQAADADEVLVDAFAQAWRDASTYDAKRGSVGAWLMTITRSRALDLIRSRGRRERTLDELVLDPAAAGLANGPASPARSAEQEERRRLLGTALQALSSAQRQAIELAFYDGLSHSEIAEKLSEPLGTVKTRVRLGLQKLREALRPYYGMTA